MWSARALFPLSALASSLAKRRESELNDPIETRGDFPLELDPMIAQYNSLLTRIGDVRTREKDFSANAAHELRTPLSGIQATLEQAVSRSRDAPDYEVRIHEALSITRGMKTLVDKLMRFARLQSGSEVVTIVSTDIHRELAIAWEKHSEAARMKRIEIEWRLAAADHERHTDPGLLGILLSNLIDNAISHSPEGEAISVNTQNDGANLQLQVLNKASGPLPDDMDWLFAPFYRLDQARSTDQSHSGIGLSLCKEIASLLGIRITLGHGEPGFVATVTFPTEQG